MKKFMKAIAFVTVMCMALSTVAFAAGDAVLSDTEKIVNVTVTGANSDQVALLVVASDATDFSNPLYIDQKAATDGTASFTAVLTNAAATVEAVDVYVGYATYATAHNEPEKVGEDVPLKKAVTNVTISNVVCTWDDYKDVGMEQNATGAVLSFDFVAPAGAVASQMEWEITYEDAQGNPKPKYTGIYDISGYGLGSDIASGSSVKLGLSFLNGSEKDGYAISEILDIKAKILFVGEDDFSQLVDAIDATPNN